MLRVKKKAIILRQIYTRWKKDITLTTTRAPQ